MSRVENKQIESENVTLRNTRQRTLVHEIVESMENHPTSTEVYQEASLRGESVSKATVYRNLDVLVQMGRLRKIEVPEEASRYDATLEPHAHAHCRLCGSVYDVTLTDDTDILNLVAQSSGITLEGYKIMFEGVCVDCRSC